MYDWKQILDENGKNVWHTICRLIDDHYEAEDCFQEVFATVFEISCRKKIQNVGGLLQHIAVRKSIDRLRKITVRRNCHTELDVNTELVAKKSGLSDAEKNELASCLTEALTLVSATEAEIFCLFYFSELPYSKIAETVGMKKNAVGVYLQRCREKLSKHLTDFNN